MPRTTNMRDRLLEAAMHLFAEQGYAATSVADIQLACGLTGGSGALYKHFASKRALLDAGVRRYLDRMDAARRDFLDHVPDDVRQALRSMLTAAWAAMDRDRDMLRVLLRDLDGFPALREQLWAAIRTNLYDQVASWLRQRRFHLDDPDATAAVLVASLSYYAILPILIGHTPGDSRPEAFTEAWVNHAATALEPHT